MVAPPRGRGAWTAAAFGLVFALHWATPAGPHEWHWLHLVAQKLLFLPVLMCAAWFGLRETLLMTALVSAAFGLHIAVQWSGRPMLQADQIAELVNVWVVAPAGWAFFRAERAAAERLRRAHAGTLLTLVSSLELRERYTAGHSRRVAAYSLLAAERLGLRDPAFLRTLETGALLHDAGKIGVPDAVLLKTGALNNEEWESMRRHPENGAALARGSDALEGAAPIIAAHHERYDGRGYPAGLAGEAIPLGARIVAAADVYDALTTARPYKPAFTHDDATAILREQSGAALDPRVVEAFSEIPLHALAEALSGARPLTQAKAGSTLGSMGPLSIVFACLLAVPASAQVVGEAASAASGTSAAGAVVSQVPGGLSSPALSPSLAPGLQGSLMASPAVAPKPGAPVPALAASLIVPVDRAALPDKGKNHTPAEWGKLVESAKDEGTKAVLRSMPGDNPSDPRLSVKLSNGESVTGAFRGLADGKMIFETGGKLVGLKMDAGGIAEVRRTVDVMFDGSNLRPDEVVVHDRPAVADPFKDLAKYRGRVVDIDMRDLDDLKWSAQTVSGRITKADGDEILLDGPKGQVHISREFHRVDKAALRTEHYSSKDKITTISDVEGKVPNGGPVEVVLAGGKTVTGRFFGVRKDAKGPYVLIEVPASGGTHFRAYRDFYDLRTPGFAKDALLPGVEPIYSAPDK